LNSIYLLLKKIGPETRFKGNLWTDFVNFRIKSLDLRNQMKKKKERGALEEILS